MTIPFSCGREAMPTSDDLLQVAAIHGITIDTDRSKTLDRQGQVLWHVTRKLEADAHASGELFVPLFTHEGLDIGVALENGNQEYKQVFIDFRPKDEKDEAVEVPTRRLATKFILQGLVGLQNYSLLVEAGYLRAPDEVRSGTNPTMARVAKRIGFESIEETDGVIAVLGSYKKIRDAVLNPEMQSTVNFLSQRYQKLEKQTLPRAIEFKM